MIREVRPNRTHPAATGRGVRAAETAVLERAPVGRWDVTARDFDAFYAACFGDVAAFCTGLVRRPDVAADLAQEAFTRVYLRWWLVQEPRPYVFRVAGNLARRHLREAAREVSAGLEHAPETAAAAGHPEVLDAVNRLPHRVRTVVLLHYYVDLPVDEVAAILGRPPGSVKRQLHEARALLGAALAVRDV